MEGGGLSWYWAFHNGKGFTWSHPLHLETVGWGAGGCCGYRRGGCGGWGGLAGCRTTFSPWRERTPGGHAPHQLPLEKSCSRIVRTSVKSRESSCDGGHPAPQVCSLISAKKSWLGFEHLFLVLFLALFPVTFSRRLFLAPFPGTILETKPVKIAIHVYNQETGHNYKNRPE